MLMQQTFLTSTSAAVTIGHLVADFDTASGIGGKVNLPFRAREDVESLWEHLLAGDIDWVVSDHACCKEEMKFGEDKEDVFAAKSASVARSTSCRHW